MFHILELIMRSWRKIMTILNHLFEKVCAQGSDSSNSRFDLDLGDGVHSPEGSIDYDTHDISTSMKSPVEMTAAATEEVPEGSGKLPSSFSLKPKIDGIYPEVNATQTKPIELEPILDVETTHITPEELTDADRAEGSIKVLEVSPDLNIVEDAKVGGDKASLHAAEEESDTTINRRRVSTGEFHLSSGAFILPHPDKVSTGGEDAYFIAGKNWIGVADGVGQWADKGINAGIYARELMESCKKIVSYSDSTALTDPKKIIIQSAREAHSPGSSTISVAYFDGQVLHVANIGDSGFIVIRKGAVHERTLPDFVDFNCPYQIKSGDDPSHLVERYRFNLEEGDVIITATDGLFDNLYEQEIVSIVTNSLEANLCPKEIAEVLAMRAQELGKSETCRTPFGDDFEDALYTEFSGGKLDDVTVIVSFVRRR